MKQRERYARKKSLAKIKRVKKRREGRKTMVPFMERNVHLALEKIE